GEDGAGGTGETEKAAHTPRGGGRLQRRCRGGGGQQPPGEQRDDAHAARHEAIPHEAAPLDRALGREGHGEPIERPCRPAELDELPCRFGHLPPTVARGTRAGLKAEVAGAPVFGYVRSRGRSRRRTCGWRLSG